MKAAIVIVSLTFSSLIVACDAPMSVPLDSPGVALGETAPPAAGGGIAETGPEDRVLVGVLDASGRYFEVSPSEFCGPGAEVPMDEEVVGLVSDGRQRSTMAITGGYVQCPCSKRRADSTERGTCTIVYSVATNHVHCLAGPGCEECDLQVNSTIGKSIERAMEAEGTVLKKAENADAAAALLAKLVEVGEDGPTMEGEGVPIDGYETSAMQLIEKLNGTDGLSAILQSAGSLPAGFSWVRLRYAGRAAAIPVRDDVIVLAKVTAATPPPTHCDCNPNASGCCELVNHGGTHYSCSPAPECGGQCTMHGYKTGDAPLSVDMKKEP